ncbi:MAG: CCA tRNA nucleotidyltransferase [Anaplasmataceae bacterium]|nr:CCA tRNA nucleotidyltransferase [Anaplasmataceae bacterium]
MHIILTNEVIDILNILKEARVVGGAVRDYILQKPIHDIDIATKIIPEQVMKMLNKHGISTIPTGLKHGTITAVFPNKVSIEITTLRCDLECDGRHAITRFSTDWLEDAERRDFTFNALYMDINGKIYDYFNGIKHLKNREINFIGDAKQRIKEDYLRILRAFRFHAQICSDIPMSLEMIEACKEEAPNIIKLSSERIKSELFKIFIRSNSYRSLKSMLELGIMQYITSINSDISKKDYYFSDKYHNPIFVMANYIRYSSIINKDEVIKTIKQELKLSKKEVYNLNLLCNKKLDLTINQEVHIQQIGYDDYLLLLSFNLHNVDISIEEFNYYLKILQNWKYKPCPTNAQDWINLGYKKEAIGLCQKTANKLWEDGEFTILKDDIIKKIINN